MTTKANFGPAALFLLLALSTASVFAQGTFYGDSASMGQGTIRSWIQTTRDSVPVAMGVTFTAGLLQGLPGGEEDVSLELPRVASDSLFTHVYFNWEPQGHPPTPYMQPHFDIHFYMISSLARRLIPAGVDTFQVPSQFVPPNYTPGPPPVQVVPGMGTHWLDSTSAEFHGHMFTHTLIYGFYHGQFIFYEPMVTRAYFMMNPDSTFQIPQPESYQRTGYYPTTYTVSYNADSYTYTVSIGGFVFRNVGGAGVDDPVAARPSGYELADNYPNPFNPSTSIQFVLPRASRVSLTIYNLLGEEVASLVDGMLSEGSHTVQFNGSTMGSGVYFYRLKTDGFVSTKKMIMLK
ncbi:MAG TPA: T9SS type A sorting domain-containing protein [bacterium]|jgi:hypothetical protein